MCLFVGWVFQFTCQESEQSVWKYFCRELIGPFISLNENNGVGYIFMYVLVGFVCRVPETIVAPPPQWVWFTNLQAREPVFIKHIAY